MRCPCRKSVFVLGLIGLCFLAQARADLTNGLVAYYPFNGNANDETGNGNNGVVNGATLTQDRFGNAHRAYSFDGTNDYIRVARQVTTNQPLTWSVWFRPNIPDTNVVAALLNQGGNPGQTMCSPRLGIGCDVFGQFDFYTYDTVPHWVLSSKRAQYDTNHWYQLVATSDVQGNRCLYVDGVGEGTATNQPFGQNLANFYIGGEVSSYSTWFSGVIDDVRIYNRALSGSEVQQLYSLESPTNPVVWINPQSQFVAVGAMATLSVVGAGAPPLSFQWRKDANLLESGTNSVLTIAGATTNDTGGYDVIITNAYGSVTSLVATLSVGYAPGIAVQPQSLIVAAGSNVSFAVVASGTAPFGYQWQYNGAGISAASNDTYVLPNAQTLNSGNYSVVVSNAFGSITSAIAILTVVAPPTITSQPQSQNAYKGAEVLFSVGVNGTAPVFQWFKGGFVMPGETNATLLFNSVQTGDNGSYWMSASNFAGTGDVRLSLLERRGCKRAICHGVGQRADDHQC